MDAVEKHKAAAEEYEKVASGIEDIEALRILKLLEDHHERLAHLVKTPAVRTIHSTSDDLALTAMLPAATSGTNTWPQETEPNATPRAVAPPASRSRSPILHRKPHRELTSSIVTDLAAARGIPSTNQRRPRNLSPIRQGKESGRRVSPNTASSDNETLSRAQEVRSKDGIGGRTRDSNHGEVVGSEKPGTATNDDAFQKFYSTFEGLLSKLSAPLAFAGLPLVSSEPAQQDQTLSKKVETTSPESSHADVEKLFSKAAMRAVKEDKGPMSGYRAVQESFCVVPAGGGTVSYANILSRPDRQVYHRPQDHPSSAQGDDDGIDYFVDASETPQPTSPRSGRRGMIVAPRSKKTMEELELENAALKHLTENLNDRLYEWEKNSQKQTSVLQQSIRSLQSYQSHSSSSRPRETVIHEGGTSHTDEVKLLQEQHDATLREMEKYARENEKLKVVVMRYRERWEKLKEGARVRREGGERGVDTPPT